MTQPPSCIIEQLNRSGYRQESPLYFRLCADRRSVIVSYNAWLLLRLSGQVVVVHCAALGDQRPAYVLVVTDQLYRTRDGKCGSRLAGGP